ncbi:unnamed protein product [Pseudo-nitzschia multistriata]|uniref:Cytokinin riboside 5'-monophosphate phosphoribohydrolase n=1 Tax=Pseudo-nitzschia multistriata TaxID=183589 RepID=A0A448YVI8_9STRA|nr:unnamed protein product [Pseudo-nitzschia multistriata]
MTSPTNVSKVAGARNDCDYDGDASADEIQRQLEESTSSSVFDPDFCFRSTAPRSLKVTCYGSSSSKTPARYLNEARLLGYILAKRGHVCINGAGSYGCMAAMNDGVHAGDGHVRGVIHEMFLADNGYFDVDPKTNQRTLLRRASSHRVFENAVVLSRHKQKQRQQTDDGARDEQSNKEESEKSIPIREILVAGGDDLQERKKFLVTNTDALIVLPGGPGTWDELWEMACARHLELNALPIVCVNVDGYYEPFREMLDRAFEDKLIRLEPEAIVRFADSAEEAVRFVEDPVSHNKEDDDKLAARRKTRNKRTNNNKDDDSSRGNLLLSFFVGSLFGIAVARSAALRRG